MSVCKVYVPNAGLRSTRLQLTMSQKPTMCGLERCANEMNWCRAGRYLFARNRHGSTTSTRFRNSTGRGIDLGPMRCELVCAQRSPAVAEVCAILSVASTGDIEQ